MTARCICYPSIGYLFAAMMAAALGWWLSPSDFAQTPFATMTSSMLGFVLFSFTAYTGAFALFVSALDRKSPSQWRWLDNRKRVRLKRFAASTLFLGAGIYLLRHREGEGWLAAIIVAGVIAGLIWCTCSSRFEQTYTEY